MTACATCKCLQDPRRLYWATDEDNAKYRTVQSITSIDRHWYLRWNTRTMTSMPVSTHSNQCVPQEADCYLQYCKWTACVLFMGHA
eukprot:1153521-Pelagomonas_calceolata.AAC.3